MTFKLGVHAQVCAFCRFVVVRTDRGLEKHGHVADLLELPSPFVVGGGGFWSGKRFEVEGRAQYDRHDNVSAPWQEFLLGFPEDGSFAWVAQAQGRWYVTYEIAGISAPPIAELRPGGPVNLGAHGAWVVQEVGTRRLVSAQGNLTGIPRPGVGSGFADLSAPEGRFGTLDYGDGSSDRPVVYLGQQFDPVGIRLDSGVPLAEPEAKVRHVQCPTCGGNLPLFSAQVERVVCQYCGSQSDVTQGGLRVLGPTPRSTHRPLIAVGTEAELRGVKVVCCGSVLRSCVVDGQRYPWTEYLLWAGPSVGYWWLMEEEGAWSLVTPLEVGDVADADSTVVYRGQSYHWKQEVRARIDHVVGEFYWKVAIGETVTAAEFAGPGGKVSRERSDSEVVYSFCGPLHPSELEAFGVRGASSAAGGDGSGGSHSGCATVFVVFVALALVLALAMADDCGGGVGGPSFGGGYYSK